MSFRDLNLIPLFAFFFSIPERLDLFFSPSRKPTPCAVCLPMMGADCTSSSRQHLLLICSLVSLSRQSLPFLVCLIKTLECSCRRCCWQVADVADVAAACWCLMSYVSCVAATNFGHSFRPNDLFSALKRSHSPIVRISLVSRLISQFLCILKSLANMAKKAMTSHDLQDKSLRGRWDVGELRQTSLRLTGWQRDFV